MKNLLFVLALFSFALTATAQKMITGNIFQSNDSTALEAVSVYYDGTNIGTSTNKNGAFSIQRYPGEATLVISFLGYKTKMISISPNISGLLPPMYLEQQQEELAEVILEPDPWSRRKKLAIFRREYLGNTPEAKKVKIKNEEVLRLYYSPSTEKLTAVATEPLIISNRFLGYNVRYELENFTVKFSTGSSGLRFTHMVLYQGFSYFSELKNRTRKKHLKNRERTYTGSSLHFMRSLSQKSLAENNFRIFHDRFQVPPYKHFNFNLTEEGMEISLLADKLSILYGELEQSGIQATSPFLIDHFGNHTPPVSVLFSGEMSTKRISHLLPLNYNLEK
ncbi:carboxypeptidase-like regulatory domain-containing protein [Salinimicrobium sp. GXAS 041]|uniref:carboxypeptidase-like regulatory domain-containing protein n=1 Tax=Salinimicrobium sp. GXAS 041 TaxID=3400806 RepID=UPI003C712A30